VRTIDRYVARNFLFSYLAVLLGLLGLAVVIDASMNLDEFLELVPAEGSALSRAGRLLGILGHWYAAKSALFFQFLAPVITVLAAIVTVVMMKRRNEFVPLLASGVSVYRALWPVLLLTLLASGLAMANQELWLPRLATRLVRDPDDPEGRKPHQMTAAFTDADGNHISATAYTPFERTLQDLHIDGRSTPTGRVRLFARKAVWDSSRDVWLLTDGWVQRFNAEGRPAARERFGAGTDTRWHVFETSLRPEDVDRPAQWVALSAVSDLVRQIRLQPAYRPLQVELHGRYVGPIRAVILLLLGLPLILMQESKSVIVGVGIGLMICFTYLGAQFVTEQMGSSGRIAPVLAVWLPIFIFGPVAVMLFDSIRT